MGEYVIARRDDGTFEKIIIHEDGPNLFDKRAILTTATDGHTHLLLMDDRQRDMVNSRGTTDTNLNMFEGLSTPGGQDGHQHPWVMTADGRVIIGETDGHTYEAAAMSTTVRDVNDRLETRERRRGAARLRQATQAAQQEAAVEQFEKFKEDLMTKTEATTPEAIAKQHQEAGTVLDYVIEKHRAKGESYVDATLRLTYEQSYTGEEYRKAAALADRLHREAQEAATTPGQRFTVTKRFPGNFSEVTVNKSAAEAELDRLAHQLRAGDPSLDYYAAYAKAADMHPKAYAKAVVG